MKNVMIVLQVLILLTLTGYGYAESNIKPLPNGVVIDGDLSVAIAKIERKTRTTDVWLSFRKLSEPEKTMNVKGRQIRGFTGARVHPEKKLILWIIDDRDNKYGKGCYGDREYAWPHDYDKMPLGFTWVVAVKIPKIPEIAPISKIELENQAEDLRPRPTFNLDFRKTEFPNLDFEIQPEQVLVTGKEMQIDKNVSFSAKELIIKDYNYKKKYYFHFCLPLEFKNADYNPQRTREYHLGLQLEDGRLFYNSHCGSQIVQALSTREEQLRMDIPGDLLEKATVVPRMFFFYERTDRGSLFSCFVPISAKLKQQYLEKHKLYLAQEGQTSNSQVASSQKKKEKPEPKPQDKIKEVEKTVKKAESIYGIFKRR